MIRAIRLMTFACSLLAVFTLLGVAIACGAETERGDSPLAKLAASMPPGSWAELQTEMPEGLWRSPLVDGGRNNGGSGGLHIAGWTDDAHWDSKTGQFLYMGLRQTRQFIAYSEEKNAWRVIELDRDSDNPCFLSRFGHIYSSNGFDPQRSRFYHRYNSYSNEKKGVDLTGGVSYFDTTTEKWTKLPPIPADSTFTGMAIEYFSALDGVLILGPQAWFFSNARQKWEPLGPCPVDGYHSLVRHNPFRNEVLMAGGNHNRRTVARLKADGTIERLKDFPTDLGVQSDKITIDPATGRYLIQAGNKNEPKQLYEFDSDQNTYRIVDAFTAGWPFTRYDMPVCAFIPEYNVSMWADSRGMFLYRHASLEQSP
ncbi:Kelch repeat-containing protein [Lignipirellula cremea]|uniref:Kelch motif protein n=1 Tax=Lignipirellula cremea TaxID=2528010 RepID=A0A518E4E2_9BACT|nr:hypothetical protein [Lignipirellula cremea]QDU98966.1 hypothetical protein Pla8534_68770 [Lignipirellula cremea]